MEIMWLLCVLKCAYAFLIKINSLQSLIQQVPSDPFLTDLNPGMKIDNLSFCLLSSECNQCLDDVILSVEGQNTFLEGSSIRVILCSERMLHLQPSP